jgi:cytochrome d ubiquinol oxidase subunit II
VIRRVPLREDGYFFLPLYTVIGGVVALVSLPLHGVLYLAMKTAGACKNGSTAATRPIWIALSLLTILSLPALTIARPNTLNNFRTYPVLLAVPLVVLAALAGVWHFCTKSDDRKAFACSGAYLAVMLVGAATALYPRLLPSSTDSSRDITIQKALSGPHVLALSGGRSECVWL